MRALIFVLALACASLPASAQWQMQDSQTTADLRGIQSLGGGVAWASGTNGTVLRTEDAGFLWQTCTIPPGAEKLDFRGIQAFDHNTAIVMSSGKGDLSRLYKTTDGCETWKQIFTSPYTPDGFLDAVLFLDARHGILFGDPSPRGSSVESPDAFRVRVTADGGTTWAAVSTPDATGAGVGLHALKDEGAFAASNSSIFARDGRFWFATSASRVAYRDLYRGTKPELLFAPAGMTGGSLDAMSTQPGRPWTGFKSASVPIQHVSPASGIFSLFFRSATAGIAVGGNYQKPNDNLQTAAVTRDGGLHWSASTTPPHGYRSSVAYDEARKAWITVGPNGTDASTDDGRNWRPLHPGGLDQPDADQHWNALSLPYVVGPHGRIGRLRDDALKP